MKLSAIFNATPERKAQLDLIEEALRQLHQQKRIADAGSDDITTLTTRAGTWTLVVARAEAMKGGRLSPDSVGVGAQHMAQAELAEKKMEVIGRIGATEYALVGQLRKVFDGADADKKLAAFFAATGPKKPLSASLKAFAAQAYTGNPDGVGIDKAIGANDVAAKFANAKVISRQIGELNALIDEGSPANRLKRWAWQLSRPFSGK